MSYSPTIIKSIQQGTVTLANTELTKTATITSVTPSKSMILLLGLTTPNNNGTYPDARMARVALTNATTVTITRERNVDALTAGFQVVEFY